MRGETPPAVNAYRSWPPLRPESDFVGDLDAAEWARARRVETTDPEPHYFDDTSAAGAEARRARIHAQLEHFIGLLGGRSLEANRAAEREGARQFQAGALAEGETVGGVRHQQAGTDND